MINEAGHNGNIPSNINKISYLVCILTESRDRDKVLA